MENKRIYECEIDYNFDKVTMEKWSEYEIITTVENRYYCTPINDLQLSIDNIQIFRREEVENDIVEWYGNTFFVRSTNKDFVVEEYDKFISGIHARAINDITDALETSKRYLEKLYKEKTELEFGKLKAYTVQDLCNLQKNNDVYIVTPNNLIYVGQVTGYYTYDKFTFYPLISCEELNMVDMKMQIDGITFKVDMLEKIDENDCRDGFQEIDCLPHYYHRYVSVYLSLEEAKYSINSTKRLNNAAEITKTKLEIKKLETELDRIIKNK